MELIHGDCLTRMKQIKDPVDMILTDPPYLINYKTNYRKDKNHDFSKPIINDNNPGLIEESIPLMYDLLKDGGALYMFCNADRVDFFKQTVEEYFKFKNILVWVKNNWTAGDLRGAYAKQTEFIIFAVKGRHLLNGKRDTDVLSYNRVAAKKQLHQNQKPVELLKYLISKSSAEGDLILDPFMGSGSTGVACNLTKRNFVGIELDEQIFKIAKKRILGNECPLFGELRQLSNDMRNENRVKF